jgi:hypothetical protein
MAHLLSEDRMRGQPINQIFTKICNMTILSERIPEQGTGFSAGNP